jgi:hypothetical protein
MKKQTIIWTTLPNGSNGTLAPGSKLKLSVFISPRLWNNDPNISTMNLADFPDFLDWPARVNMATFQVSFEGGPSLVAMRESNPAQSNLWQALFEANTLVKPYEFEDLTGAEILTFPSTEILDVIQGVYQRAASEAAYGGGTDLPQDTAWDSDPDLVEIAPKTRPPAEYDPGDMDIGPVEVEQPPDMPPDIPPEEPCGCLCVIWRWIVKILKWLGLWSGEEESAPPIAPVGARPEGPQPSRATPVAGNPSPELAGEPEFAPSPKKVAFDSLQTYVYTSEKTVPADLPTQAEIDQQYDFHSMVSTLGNYPRLLRELGLVVDLSVTLLAGVPAGTATIKVKPTLALALSSTNYTPRTHYEAGDGYFRARPRPGSDLNAGLLRLDDSSRFRLTSTDVAGGGVKLRNMATTLRAFREHTRRPSNRPPDEGLPSLQTTGISIVRPGLAIKVKETFSIAYALNKALTLVDGSPAKPPAGGSAPSETDELYAEDVRRGYRVDVFDDQSDKWHSLCERQGAYKFLDLGGMPLSLEDEGFIQIGVTEDLTPSPDPRKLKTHESLFTWDGWSLSAPRPGKIILADDTQTGDQPNTAATPFRLETEFKPKPGSLPRLRFGYTYRLRARLVDLAGNSDFQPGDPAFQQNQAEISSPYKFDRYEPINPPPLLLKAAPKEGESLETLVVRSTYDALAVDPKENQAERHILPPKVSQLMSERHGRFDQAPGMMKDSAGYQLASREASILTHRWNQVLQAFEQLAGVQELTTPEHTYWLQANDTHEVAYLPDPIARGVLLLGLPGMAAFDQIIEPDGTIVNKIPFAGAWPDLKPFRLRLVGILETQPPLQPTWDAVNRVLEVQIPQGMRAQVRISSYILPVDLENQAIFGWLLQKNPANLAQLKQQAESGRGWLYMPYRELTLVHAVQQPLKIPELVNLGVQPHPVNPATQNRSIGDTTVPLVGTIKVDAKSTAHLDLHAEWSDPFDDLSKDSYTPGVDEQKFDMYVGQVPVSNPTLDQFAIKPLVHGIGDTKYHHIAYWGIAATRFREFFDQANPAIAADLVRPTAAELGTPAAMVAERAVDVFNTTRPAAVRPETVLPIFSWEQVNAGAQIVRTRKSSGLRIYLERPWYSSGAGELLGVILRPAGINPEAAEMEILRKYISEWGMDPLWLADETAPLAITDFANPDKTGTQLSISELGWAKFNVVGYQVNFEPERKLWFCDVLLEAGRHYFPFVRLALARYQPNSIPDAHLSTVALSDFCQVVPHRQVVYEPIDTLTGKEVKIRLSGPAYFQRQWEKRGSPVVMAVLMQSKQAAMPGDLDWEIIPGTAVVLNPIQQDPAETIWEGSTRLLNPLPNPLRAAVFEYELFLPAFQFNLHLEGMAPEGLNPEEVAHTAEFEAAVAEAAREHQGMIIIPPTPYGARMTFFDAVTI